MKCKQCSENKKHFTKPPPKQLWAVLKQSYWVLDYFKLTLRRQQCSKNNRLFKFELNVFIFYLYGYSTCIALMSLFSQICSNVCKKYQVKNIFASLLHFKKIILIQEYCKWLQPVTVMYITKSSFILVAPHSCYVLSF